MHQISSTHHYARLVLQFCAYIQHLNIKQRPTNYTRPQQQHKPRVKKKIKSNQNQLAIPVSLISTTQSSHNFSSKRRNETSCGRSPGHVSSARMSSTIIGVDDSVANSSRCLRLWLPCSLLYVVFPISRSLSLSLLRSCPVLVAGR